MVLKIPDAIQAGCSKCKFLSTLALFMLCFVALLSDHATVIGGKQLVLGVSVGDDIAGAVQHTAALTGSLGKCPKIGRAHV